MSSPGFEDDQLWNSGQNLAKFPSLTKPGGSLAGMTAHLESSPPSATGQGSTSPKPLIPGLGRMSATQRG